MKCTRCGANNPEIARFCYDCGTPLSRPGQIQPLTFPQNESATDLPSLADCCARHWDYSRRILYDGTVENWLRSALTDPITADKAKSSVKSWKDQDVGLDSFIREINPAFPPPRLQVSPARVDAGSLAWQQTRQLMLDVTNAGHGALQAQITTTAPWLSVTPAVFSCVAGRTVRLTATVDANKLDPGQSYQAHLTLDAGIGGRAQVPVTVAVPAPQMIVDPQTLNLGSAYQGETLTKTFTVRNTGGSAFEGQVSCDQAWASADPGAFRVEPGVDRSVSVRAETSRMGLGRHVGQATVRAQSGSWHQSSLVDLRLTLPWLKTFWARYKLPATVAALILLVLLAWGAVMARTQIQKAACYRDAQAHFDAQQWELAATQFEQCGQYRNAAEKAKEACYNKAQELMDVQQWEQAGAQFEQCGLYHDAPERVKEACYNEAQELLDAQQWEQAAVQFEQCGQYGDAPAMALEAHSLALERHSVAYEAYLQAGDMEAAKVEWTWLVALWQNTHILEGPAKACDSLAFSPDWAIQASASCMHVVEGNYSKGDDGVQLWRASDGALLHILQGHTDSVFSVTFSPDGTVLASGGEDTTIRLWQVSGQPLHTLETGYSVMSLAFSPDGATLAEGSLDNRVRLWRVSDGTLLRTLEGHTDWVESVAFSPDGATLASGSKDNMVRLWRVSDGTLIRTLVGHTGLVQSVAFSPDGAKLASGALDLTVRLWRVSDGALLHTLEHAQRVTSVAFSPDRVTLASAAEDFTVRLWWVPDGTLLRTLEDAGYLSVAFSPDGTTLGSWLQNDKVLLWGMP